MALLSSDIKILKSEVMNDTVEGGGRMTTNEVVNGQINNIFPSISELNTVEGNISFRKVYGGVLTADTETFYGANVIVSDPPDDPLVNVALFTTKSYSDRRNGIKDYLETYVVPAAQYPGFVLTGASSGDQILTIFGNVTSGGLLTAGNTYVLISGEGTNNELSEYFSVVKVVSNTSTGLVSSTGQSIDTVVYQLSNPLTNSFTGSNLSGTVTNPPTILRFTTPGYGRTFYGVKALETALVIGDKKVKVDSPNLTLIPKSVSLSHVAGTNPVPGVLLYTATGAEVTASYTTDNLFKIALPSGFLPGSLKVNTHWSLSSVVEGVWLPAPPARNTLKGYLPLYTKQGYYANGDYTVATVSASINYSTGEITLPSSVGSGTSVSVTYIPASYATVPQLSERLDINSGNAVPTFTYTLATVPTPGSLRVNVTFIGRNYTIYDDYYGSLFSDSAGVSGTVNYTTGAMVISLPIAPDLGSSMVFSVASASGNNVSATQLYLPNPPYAEGSVILNFTKNVSGDPVSLQVPLSGTLTTSDYVATANVSSGLVSVTATSGAAGLKFNPATMTYDADIEIPQVIEEAILGANSIRLPTDGKVPIFKQGSAIVVHNTQTIAAATYTAAQTVNCGRPRVNFFQVKDSTGAIVPKAGVYSTDPLAGTLTFISVAGLSQPLTIVHRIEDMVLVTGVTYEGLMNVNIGMSHAYPTSGTYVSSALILGDLVARVSVPFDQQTWTSVWSNTLIGNNTLASFNNAGYPIVTSNLGAQQDRWAIIFDNTTTYRVIGEESGQIATGSITADCSPMNSNTGAPYFTIPYLGWGSGWAAGYVLRFNTYAANYPIDLIRTVQQGVPSLTSDSFTLILRGNAN